MPPLLGLMHSSRRSTDIPLHHVAGLASSGQVGEAMVSDILKAPAAGTGGLMESIANMANSILGAGIIGPFCATFFTQAGLYFFRTPLCDPRGWARYWYTSFSYPMRYHRLDDTVNRHKCEIEWPELLHRCHGSEFRFSGAGCYFFLSVCLCVWW